MVVQPDQGPIVVEVFRQPEITPDIGVDVVLGMFSLAGVMVVAAAVGGLVVGAIFVGIRRFRESSPPPPAPKDQGLGLSQLQETSTSRNEGQAGSSASADTA